MKRKEPDSIVETKRNQFEKQLTESLADSSDLENREMIGKGKKANLFFVKSVCDPNVVKRYIVTPFWETESEEEFKQYIMSFPGSEKYETNETAVEKVLEGYIGIFFENDAYFVEAVKENVAPVSETTVESNVQGPKSALSEDIRVSLNMIRNRYKTEELKVEMQTIGELSKTKVAIVYDQDNVDQVALKSLKEELSRVNEKIIQAAGDLQRYITKDKWGIFPRTMITERPDRVIKGISEGKIAVFIDKTSFAMVVPTKFSEFFSAMDDFYQLRVVGGFLKALRYIGFVLTMILPGMYIGTVSYNPEFFRVQLAFSIFASRAAVPYASYLEVIFMLLMMEFLTEASIRLPKAIGPTATTVGGLILGQAATSAGLISNIMIIIVAIVGISNYVIPIIEMNFAIRIIKYLIVFLSTIAGLVGVIIGIIILVFYLANIESFGRPYVKAIRKKGEE